MSRRPNALALALLLLAPVQAFADVAPSCKCDATAGAVAPSLGGVLIVAACLGAVLLVRRLAVR